MTKLEALKTIVLLDRKDNYTETRCKLLMKALHALGFNLDETREFCKWFEYPVEAKDVQ